MTIKNDAGNKKITAENILVGRYGNFTVGNATGPYTGKLEITITGDRTTRGVGIDNELNNKVLAVLGGLDMKTDFTAAARTRLTATAAVGATTI